MATSSLQLVLAGPQSSWQFSHSCIGLSLKLPKYARESTQVRSLRCPPVVLEAFYKHGLEILASFLNCSSWDLAANFNVPSCY